MEGENERLRMRMRMEKGRRARKGGRSEEDWGGNKRNEEDYNEGDCS